jgi:hypothetical protein
MAAPFGLRSPKFSFHEFAAIIVAVEQVAEALSCTSQNQDAGRLWVMSHWTFAEKLEMALYQWIMVKICQLMSGISPGAVGLTAMAQHAIGIHPPRFCHIYRS